MHSLLSKARKALAKSLRKAVKPANKYLKRNGSSLLFVFLGVTIFLFGFINYYRVRVLSFSKVPPEAVRSTQNLDIPAEVSIPSLKIDLPVDPGQIKDGVWQISGSNATFLDTSAVPGSGGNTVIYGHNKKIIFGNLPYLSVGQKIIVKTKSGKVFNYVAKEKFFVGPDRVDLVSPSSGEELTIYTCWGIFDSQRAIIKAFPSN